MTNNQNNRVKIELVCNSEDYSTAATIDSILVLDKAGLTAISGVLTNYFDMYRWWKLTKVEVETLATFQNAADNSPFWVALVQPDAVAPTSASTFETTSQKLVGRYDSAAQSRLTLGTPELAQIGNKMPTHSDGAIETLDSYGTIYHGSIGANLTFTRHSRFVFHIEFFVLTDPDTLATYISERFQAEANTKPNQPQTHFSLDSPGIRRLQISRK